MRNANIVSAEAGTSAGKVTIAAYAVPDAIVIVIRDAEGCRARVRVPLDGGACRVIDARAAEENRP